MQVRGDVQHGGGVLAWLQHHVPAAGAAGGALGAQSGGAEMAARVTVCQIRLSTFANVYIAVNRKLYCSTFPQLLPISTLKSRCRYYGYFRLQ